MDLLKSEPVTNNYFNTFVTVGGFAFPSWWISILVIGIAVGFVTHGVGFYLIRRD